MNLCMNNNKLVYCESHMMISKHMINMTKDLRHKLYLNITHTHARAHAPLQVRVYSSFLPYTVLNDPLLL